MTAASLLDATFDTSLDYLAYWMDQAVTAWNTLTGGTPDSVDVVTHSTGGLVSRSYVQSAAYGAAENLLPIHMLIQTGVPNLGRGAPFVMLQNDFSGKSASRLAAKILKDVWALRQSGKDIKNPDGTVLTAVDEAEFIGKYVATFQDLTATYDFIDADDSDDTALYDALTESNDVFNALLTDLNAYNLDAFVARGQLDVEEDDLDAFLANADLLTNGGNADGIVTMAELLHMYDAGAEDGHLATSEASAVSAADTGDDFGAAADGFISYDELLRLLDRQTYIVYSDGVDTADLVLKHTGPSLSLGSANEVIGFNSTLIGSLPDAGQVWYQLQNHPTRGDGTVSAFSASEGFAASRLVEVSGLAGAPVDGIEHTGITHDEVSQRKILELLGVTDSTVASISTSLLLSSSETGIRLIEIGVIDPVALAGELYQETAARLDALKAAVDSELDQDLPLLNQSLYDLLGDQLSSLGLDNLFDSLTDAVALPTIGTAQERLDSFERAIETALGLSPRDSDGVLLGADEFSLSTAAEIEASGVIVLGFDLSRSDSVAFDIDLSSSGPLSGTLPVILTGEMVLQFNVTLDAGALIPAAGESDANALSFELVDFSFTGNLSATDISVAIGYDGLGSLDIEGGSIDFVANLESHLTIPLGKRLHSLIYSLRALSLMTYWNLTKPIPHLHSRYRSLLQHPRGQFGSQAV